MIKHIKEYIKRKNKKEPLYLGMSHDPRSEDKFILAGIETTNKDNLYKI